MRTIARITLDNKLGEILPRLRAGKVLDVGAKSSPHLKDIPHEKYVRLDIRSDSNPDIVADIHKTKLPSNSFDTIIATEVLEHLYSPQKAVNEMYRILQPGGKCVLSTRFIYKYHPDPNDYFRYSQDGLKQLFNQFNKVKIYSLGNRFHVVWQIFTDTWYLSVLNILSPLVAKVNFPDKDFPLGFIVVAKK